MNTIQYLDAAIRVVCPINGVGADRVISFADEATQEQRQAAQGIADAWDFDTPAPAQRREQAKAARTAAVAAITVTTSTGKTFDGDEASQTRMARAIIGLQAAGVPTITWTLANNAVVDVTLAELTEALILSGQQQAALWPIPE